MAMEKGDKIVLGVILGGIILSLLWMFVSCAKQETIEEPEPLEKIILNVCKINPELIDYWSKTKINLFDKPEGVKVGELPSCSSISLDVLEKRTVDGVEFYKVRYGNTVGWQTKRLLTGEDDF